jgi:hypothetical protein
VLFFYPPPCGEGKEAIGAKKSAPEGALKFLGGIEEHDPSTGDEDGSR